MSEDIWRASVRVCAHLPHMLGMFECEHLYAKRNSLH